MLKEWGQANTAHNMPSQISLGQGKVFIHTDLIGKSSCNVSDHLYHSAASLQKL